MLRMPCLPDYEPDSACVIANESLAARTYLVAHLIQPTSRRNTIFLDLECSSTSTITKPRRLRDHESRKQVKIRLLGDFKSEVVEIPKLRLLVWGRFQSGAFKHLMPFDCCFQNVVIPNMDLGFA